MHFINVEVRVENYSLLGVIFLPIKWQILGHCWEVFPAQALCFEA